MPCKYAAKGKPYNDDSMNNAIREISEAKDRNENISARKKNLQNANLKAKRVFNGDCLRHGSK